MAILVKNPPSGYGQNLNPCVDCHSLMIRRTSAIMKERGYDLIATGEVLGQRPFSQNREALDRVSKLSGVEILRPLSAKLLEETTAEKSGLVDRSRLLDISGRSRERQMELAKRFGIEKYPSPAGGCLLTDPDFAARLMKMLDYWPECTANDIELLKLGRPYWFAEKGTADKVLAVVGRKHEDNLALTAAAQTNDLIIEMTDEVGPTSLLRKKNGQWQTGTNIIEQEIPEELKLSAMNLGEAKTDADMIDAAIKLTGWYAVKARGRKLHFLIKHQ
jgi:tRNA U34 2-thiouridine synthase MnmA/TrmU